MDKQEMKHVLSILTCLLFVISLYAHTYTNTSLLSSGDFVKIRTVETGVYKIPYDSLKAWGLTPENVRIYGYGGAMLNQNFMANKIDDLPAVPFYMDKGSDGVFGKGDFILFYAQGPVSWNYTGVRFQHTTNTYSQFGYYFLTDNAGEQKLLTPAEPLSASGAYNVVSYTNHQVHERDSINLVDAKNGASGGGREFFGEELSAINKTLSINFNFPNIITTKKLMTTLYAATASSATSTYTINLGSYNYSLKITPTSSDHYKKADTGSGNYSITPQAADDQKFNITFEPTDKSALGYINYLEVSAQCSLRMNTDYLSFRNVEHIGAAENSVYTILNTTESTQIWNVTKLDNIYQMPTSAVDGGLSFVAANTELQEFIAVNPNGQYACPRMMGKIEKQNLHALKNIDFVIITPSQFLTAANKLAAAHEQIDGLTTAVVTDQQVYNEFSSGTPDASAYRWLMKMLYDRFLAGESSAPRYLLLMGDGSFDNRKILSTSPYPTLLTYQAKNSVNETKAYATDDYFGFLDDIEGQADVSDRLDIGVGRFPVNTVEEAMDVTDKVIRYMQNQNLGNWKNQLCFLADDGDNGMHTKSADLAAESVRKRNPDFIVNKIYIDAYQQETSASGESYPLAESRFDNLLRKGVFMLDYCGHGGYNNITSESVMNAKDIKEMTNMNQGLWAMATCNFSCFDASLPSCGELAILNPNGGAIGVFAACRTVYANQNETINKNFCDTLFAHNEVQGYYMRLGDAVRCAKNRTGNDENKLAYLLLGDPALKLNYPNQYQVVTTSALDTVSALSTNTLTGYIQDAEGAEASWFNGKMQITIFDKQQELKTLDNDHADPASKSVYTYVDYPNTIFSGEVNVVNGKFEHTFMTPLDIRYNYGNGKIVYYAYDTEDAAEAVGNYSDFLVGGSSTITYNDTTGPNLNIYLNNVAFVNGGKTDESPHFFADLFDEHGINTVGSGIGHDLLLIVDNDPQQTFVVNDYYTAAGSYKEGQVSYKLRDLEEGKHELYFRGWDMLNNSSSASLQFEVVKGLDPEIFSVMTYPNPARVSGNVNMLIQHDQPDEYLQCDVYVYDLSGHLVWHQSEQGTGTASLHWNISDAGMHTGMYIYNVQLTTQEQTHFSKAGKIIVIKD